MVAAVAAADAELLDISEAARFLSVSETSLRRWTNTGALPCLRIGRRRERRFRRVDLLAFMEHEPRHSRRGEALPALIPTALPSEVPVAQANAGHLCGFYDNNLGRATLAVPFLLEGLQEGSMVYFVASDRSIKTIVRYLKEKRPSLERDIAAGKFLACDYRRDPPAQIKDFAARLNEAAAAGSQSFRVFGDTWELRRKTSADAFRGYEASYDQFIARKFPVVTLCAYDVRRFSGVDVLGALKAHRDIFRYPLERALA